jgi:ATP adenylyltransferase
MSDRHPLSMCRFCPELEEDGIESEFAQIAGEPLASRIAAQGEKFVLVPTLGPLVRGHFLLLPRRHVRNFGLLTDDEAMDAHNILAQVSAELARRYSAEVMLFEHGAVSEECPIGACLEHAHIHLVPLSTDLSDPLTRRYGVPTAASVADLRNPALAGHGYLWVHDSVRGGRYWTAEIVPSQLLRQLVAGALNMHERADWRTNPGLELVRQTLGDARELNLSCIATPGFVRS